MLRLIACNIGDKVFDSKGTTQIQIEIIWIIQNKYRISWNILTIKQRLLQVQLKTKIKHIQENILSAHLQAQSQTFLFNI